MIEGYATLPDGSRKWLIRIPDWDLNWQGVFRYKSPVLIPKDSVVTMRIHYDNSTENVRNPNNPPKRVTGGTDAASEMSHLWLQVLPVAEGDHRAELQESVSAQQLQKYPRRLHGQFPDGRSAADAEPGGGGDSVLPDARRSPIRARCWRRRNSARRCSRRRGWRNRRRCCGTRWRSMRRIRMRGSTWRASWRAAAGSRRRSRNSDRCSRRSRTI